jgi:hypothetical protein
VKVHATQTKKMVLVFFDVKGIIYMNYVPKGKTVNAEYVKNVLARLLKVFREKRPIRSSQEWFLHWDNALGCGKHGLTTSEDRMSVQLEKP